MKAHDLGASRKRKDAVTSLRQTVSFSTARRAGPHRLDRPRWFVGGGLLLVMPLAVATGFDGRPRQGYGGSGLLPGTQNEHDGVTLGEDEQR
ncbi:hypothetical protein CE197_27590 (plasmid) [Mycobacterium intracellulare subsp. chimaera]|nr:hypothetical protein CE197_27590 [Mycobacterium intracellulare subsp. chimaera]